MAEPEQDAAREAWESALLADPEALLPTAREIWAAAWAAGVAYGRATLLAEQHREQDAALRLESDHSLHDILKTVRKVRGG